MNCSCGEDGRSVLKSFLASSINSESSLFSSAVRIKGSETRYTQVRSGIVVVGKGQEERARSASTSFLPAGYTSRVQSKSCLQQRFSWNCTLRWCTSRGRVYPRGSPSPSGLAITLDAFGRRSHIRSSYSTIHR